MNPGDQGPARRHQRQPRVHVTQDLGKLEEDPDVEGGESHECECRVEDAPSGSHLGEVKRDDQPENDDQTEVQHRRHRIVDEVATGQDVVDDVCVQFDSGEHRVERSWHDVAQAHCIRANDDDLISQNRGVDAAFLDINPRHYLMRIRGAIEVHHEAPETICRNRAIPDLDLHDLVILGSEGHRWRFQVGLQQLQV